MVETLPWDIIEPAGAAILGWKLKMAAQDQANRAHETELRIMRNKQANESANEADNRGNGASGGAIARRWFIGLILLTGVGGFLLAMWGGYSVGVVHETPIKEHLFGLFTTGGKMKELVTVSDLIITPELKRITLDTSLFLFGSGVAKVR